LEAALMHALDPGFSLNGKSGNGTWRTLSGFLHLPSERTSARQRSRTSVLLTKVGPYAYRIAFRKADLVDHRDCSKRERRSIVAQRDADQDAEGITRFERTRRGCNQRFHRNTATLVTRTMRFPVPNYPRPTTSDERRTESRSSLKVREIRPN
jgi:hypothetical protein